ncbi:MAG: hypothetical protein CSA81_07090 [Acidobacteria bacterium]|nr:MAG: hypothetical protein CSA81_07090 [Acidobacteriota bacterium]PIE89480.1 MAG: hypothetical protein CR997_10955 [Acidobacteriota bacterium]
MKTKPFQFAALTFLVLIGVIYWRATVRELSPEEKVRVAIDAMVEGAERRELDPFEEYLSDAIKDQAGQGKQEILHHLRILFLRHREIHLSIRALEIEGTGQQTRSAKMYLLMSSTLIPQNEGLYNLTFQNENGEWRLWQMDWGEGYGVE